MNQPSPGREAGQDAAFERLFRQHYGELCAFAHRYVRSRAVAEEIVQDVFLRIWKRRGEKDVLMVRRAYLYRAVRNQSIKHHSRARTEEKWRRKGIGIVEDQSIGIEQAWVTRARTLAVQRAVESLPPRCKEIFLAVRVEGLRYAEVAKILGISPKTVEAQMVRAVKLLRQRLSEHRPD